MYARICLVMQLFAENKEKLILAALDTLLSYHVDGKPAPEANVYVLFFSLVFSA